jgi:hypothetical protein
MEIKLVEFRLLETIVDGNFLKWIALRVGKMVDRNCDVKCEMIYIVYTVDHAY